MAGSITSFSAVSSDPLLGWVALNIDGVAVDSVNLTTAGTSVIYDHVWDTTQYANGSSHEIRVTGHSEAGNVYSAGTITVTVDNSIP